MYTLTLIRQNHWVHSVSELYGVREIDVAVVVAGN
ncbi:hypothetical protein NIES2107_29840 [Nostoc carneum NIES-2107]|nr:hypothetical protein NIES2107_29840 [Nostoc carneum NIES-2107]